MKKKETYIAPIACACEAMPERILDAVSTGTDILTDNGGTGSIIDAGAKDYDIIIDDEEEEETTGGLAHNALDYLPKKFKKQWNDE